MRLFRFLPLPILLLAIAPGAGAQPRGQRGYQPAEPIDHGRWITDDDYPAAAIRAEAEGRTVVRFKIGVDGRIAGCSVVASAGHPALDEAACALLTARARYRPARYAGRPVTSTRTQSIAWQLPREWQPVALARGYVLVTLPVRREGELRCDKQASVPGLMPLAEDLCGEMLPEESDAVLDPPQRLIVAMIGPADQPLPRPPAVSDRLGAWQEVRFDVAPDGAVSNCVATPSPPAAGTLDLCDFFTSGGEPYFEAAPGGVRPTRLRIEYYDPRGVARI